MAWTFASSGAAMDHLQARRVDMILAHEPPAERRAVADGWSKDTVRGFFAGLKKKGITVEVAERIRQVGPNRAGCRGSYTVYRVAGA